MTSVLLMNRKRVSVSPAKNGSGNREHSSIEKRYITFEAQSTKYRGQSYLARSDAPSGVAIASLFTTFNLATRLDVVAETKRACESSVLTLRVNTW